MTTPKPPKGMYQFIEFEAYTKKLDLIGGPALNGLVQGTLPVNPTAGVLWKGGIRKVRVKAPGPKGGKSGGYRVFFYFVDRQGRFYLLAILDKREAGNLKPAVLKTMQTMMKLILKRSQK